MRGRSDVAWWMSWGVGSWRRLIAQTHFAGLTQLEPKDGELLRRVTPYVVVLKNEPFNECLEHPNFVGPVEPMEKIECGLARALPILKANADILTLRLIADRFEKGAVVIKPAAENVSKLNFTGVIQAENAKTTIGLGANVDRAVAFCDDLCFHPVKDTLGSEGMPTTEKPTPEPLSPEIFECVTKEKAEFIEKQADDMYDFVLESREILTREAHTTLQWLFAILIGSSGYLVTLFSKAYDPKPIDLPSIWWLIVSLALAAGWASFEAFQLIKNALRAKGIAPKGNSARNLTGNRLMEYTDFQMRFLEAWRVQWIVEDAIEQNRETGKAINRARTAVVEIPAVAVFFLLTLAMLSRIGFPWGSAIVTAAALLAFARWVSGRGRRSASGD